MNDGVAIVLPNWLGDAIMALPAVEALRKGLDGPCTLIARPAVADLARVFGDDVRVAGRAAAQTGLMIGQLQQIRPRVFVSFPQSLRAAVMAVGSGAPIRVGWAAGAAGRAYTVAVPHTDRTVHQSTAYLRIPHALGLSATTHWPSPDALVDVVSGRGSIVLAPGASYGGAKRWPGAYYASLARDLRQKTGMAITLVGARAEAGVIQQIASSAGPEVENLAGRTTLRELATLLRRAPLFVGNDSGVAHLAAWVGCPVLAIFGSTSPAWTRPIGERVRIVYREEPCGPCFKRSCPLGHTACLVRIRPEELLATCLSLMAGEPGDTPSDEVPTHA